MGEAEGARRTASAAGEGEAAKRCEALRDKADVAQLVEHSLGKGEVTSSILVIGSTKLSCEIF